MPSLASMSARIPSLHGSAPKKPARSGSAVRSTPCSPAYSAMNSAYEGVQVSTVEPKSTMVCSCRKVFPEDIGNTIAPSVDPP